MRVPLLLAAGVFIGGEAWAGQSALSTPAQGNAPAASPAFDEAWRRVQQLEPRTTIFVTPKGSATIKRWFVSADPVSLGVRELKLRDQTVETIPRRDIVEIRAPKPRGLGRKVGFGFLGYFIGGMGAGVLGVSAFGQGGLAAALPGGIIGAFVGARGGIRRPYETIYSQ